MVLHRDAALPGFGFRCDRPDKERLVPSRETKKIVNLIGRMRVRLAPVYFLAPSINSMKRVRAA